ncbi:MAG: Rieske (2Fe-2S) protein [Candidatus Eiseniibacteriota bacterium]
MANDDWRDEPSAPEAGTVLGPLTDLPENDGREYTFGEGRDTFSMFVIRCGDGVRAYVNVCPHLQMALNFSGDSFMAADGVNLFCPMHEAIFRVEDGKCIGGPPEGEALTAIPVAIEGGRIVVK